MSRWPRPAASPSEDWISTTAWHFTPLDSSGIRQIAVVGAGLMGHGIAQEFAAGGYDVRLTSRSKAGLERAEAQIRNNLDRMAALGVFDRSRTEEVMSRVHLCADMEDAVGQADLVIEAVYEDLPLKQRIFQRLDRACPAHTILASTTSTFGASQISTVRPDRVLVAHYVNPPYLVPLVEVVPSPETADTTVAAIRELLTRLGKQPVVLTREVPGFISVRLQAALLREALSLVQSGAADAEAVDTVIKTSLGRRWAVAGVFEVLDLAGWDTVSDISSWLFQTLDRSEEPPAVLRDRVERGELGVKSSRGFYDWTPESAEELRRRIGRALVEIGRWQTTPPP